MLTPDEVLQLSHGDIARLAAKEIINQSRDHRRTSPRSPEQSSEIERFRPLTRLLFEDLEQSDLKPAFRRNRAKLFRAYTRALRKYLSALQLKKREQMMLDGEYSFEKVLGDRATISISLAALDFAWVCYVLRLPAPMVIVKRSMNAIEVRIAYSAIHPASA